MSAVVRPDWWCYPFECPAGHPWAPGRVTVGWMPCDCRGAQSNDVLGHLWVRCRATGCPSIWYRPRHDKGVAQLAEDTGLADRREVRRPDVGHVQERLSVRFGQGDRACARRRPR